MTRCDYMDKSEYIGLRCEYYATLYYDLECGSLHKIIARCTHHLPPYFIGTMWKYTSSDENHYIISRIMGQ